MFRSATRTACLDRLDGHVVVVTWPATRVRFPGVRATIKRAVRPTSRSDLVEHVPTIVRMMEACLQRSSRPTNNAPFVPGEAEVFMSVDDAPAIRPTAGARSRDDSATTLFRSFISIDMAIDLTCQAHGAISDFVEMVRIRSWHDNRNTILSPQIARSFSTITRPHAAARRHRHRGRT